MIISKFLNKSLTANDGLTFKFGKDGDGNYGFYGADDSLIPFSQKSFAYALRSASSSGISYTAKDKCIFVLNMNFSSNYGYYIYLVKNGTYLVNETGERVRGSYNLIGELLPGDSISLEFRPGDIASYTISGYFVVGPKIVDV